MEHEKLDGDLLQGQSCLLMSVHFVGNRIATQNTSTDRDEVEVHQIIPHHEYIRADPRMCSILRLPWNGCDYLDNRDESILDDSQYEFSYGKILRINNASMSSCVHELFREKGF